MKNKIVFWALYCALIVVLAKSWLSPNKIEPIGIKQTTLDLIHRFEGYSAIPYQDSTGRWTIGFGHQIKDSEPHLLFATLAKRDGKRLLERDLSPCERFLKHKVGHTLNQPQFDALMSLCHNIGVDNLARSSVMYHLERGEIKKAGNAILNWNKPSELIKRRQEERKLFLSDI